MGTQQNGARTVLGDALFGATRQRVLALLSGHPDQRFYQRQIIRSVGLGSGGVQRELDQLSDAGILVRTTEGHQTYFQANRECPIFDELRRIVRKTFGLSQVLVDALAPLQGRIEIAFVFGSIASGSENASSDIDLMIVGDVQLVEVVTAIAEAQRELGREVNPSIYPHDEFCRKLAAGHHFITQVIESPKLFLIGDEQQLRAFSHFMYI
ncbi:MAG: ArsR family transcriptional regulator [Acidobacteria bacterium]|nr:ArsR family transcriptional regulator [Acidobacteriota bacterium]